MWLQGWRNLLNIESVYINHRRYRHVRFSHSSYRHINISEHHWLARQSSFCKYLPPLQHRRFHWEKENQTARSDLVGTQQEQRVFWIESLLNQIPCLQWRLLMKGATPTILALRLQWMLWNSFRKVVWSLVAISLEKWIMCQIVLLVEGVIIFKDPP